MKAACMSPTSGLDIHPLSPSHVSDFVAGLFLPSTVHIYPLSQATTKFYFCISVQHLSYDHGCLPKVVKCKLNTTLPFRHSFFSPHEALVSQRLLCGCLGPAHNGVAAVCQIIIILECRTQS